MNDPSPENREIRQIGRLLGRTAELAREVSMTGSLERGARRAAQQFNLAVSRLEELGALPLAFFPRLSEEAGMDEVGVASAQLAAYLGEPDAAASREGAESTLFGTLIINHPGDLKELEALRRLRRSLRETHPDLLEQLGGDVGDAETAREPGVPRRS